MLNFITKVRVYLLKAKARRLYYANLSNMDNSDCGFALRDHLSGGRLSRRESHIKELISKARHLEGVGDA